MQFTSLENEKRYFLKWSDVDRNDTAVAGMALASGMLSIG